LINTFVELIGTKSEKEKKDYEDLVCTDYEELVCTAITEFSADRL